MKTEHHFITRYQPNLCILPAKDFRKHPNPDLRRQTTYLMDCVDDEWSRSATDPLNFLNQEEAIKFAEEAVAEIRAKKTSKGGVVVKVVKISEGSPEQKGLDYADIWTSGEF